MSSPKRIPSAACLAALLLAGCPGSEGGDRQEVYPVSGKVTMGGGPVANAAVIFSPKEGQPVATGRTNDKGEFTVTTYESGDGAAAGKYVVLVSKEVAPSNSTGPATGHDPNNPTAFRAPSHSGAQLRGLSSASSGLPEKYSRADQSDLNVEVKSDGENNFNLELKP
ncbi:MAG TPA: carboxypeptidase-like regulatory domain-containing protein [Planctomycetaceae bacterium]